MTEILIVESYQQEAINGVLKLTGQQGVWK